ncbi:MAG TPA: hypothetical protein VGQ37_23050 [Vicinamibacterales bacterium]|nr:hypothetical protein [Vicinamibacterales bacterium]
MIAPRAVECNAKVSAVSLQIERVKLGMHRERLQRRHVDEACLPEVIGGGDPAWSVNSPVELSEKEVLFEFSRDGDDRNLCFVGSKGLLAVEKGTVKFGRVFGGAIAFTFTGDFKRFDGEGGESASTVHASGSGTATIE